MKYILGTSYCNSPWEAPDSLCHCMIGKNLIKMESRIILVKNLILAEKWKFSYTDQSKFKGGNKNYWKMQQIVWRGGSKYLFHTCIFGGWGKIRTFFTLPFEVRYLIFKGVLQCQIMGRSKNPKNDGRVSLGGGPDLRGFTSDNI